jgi:hypothetical protein
MELLRLSYIKTTPHPCLNVRSECFETLMNLSPFTPTDTIIFRAVTTHVSCLQRTLLVFSDKIMATR